MDYLRVTPTIPLTLGLLIASSVGAAFAATPPPRVLLQRGDTGPSIQGQVSAIGRLVGLDGQGRALVGFSDAGGLAVGLGASAASMEVRVRAGTQLSTGGQVGNGPQPLHLLADGAYLVSTDVYHNGEEHQALLRVGALGAVQVVLDCGANAGAPDAAVRTALCSALGSLGTDAPRHDEVGRTLIFGEDPKGSAVTRVYHFSPSGAVRRLFDVATSDQIPGLPAGLALVSVFSDTVRLRGDGQVYATLEFSDGTNSVSALVQEDGNTGARILLSANGSNIPGVPVTDHIVTALVVGEATPSDTYVLVRVSPRGECQQSCQSFDALHRMDQDGNFNLLSPDLDVLSVYATGTPPHVAAVVQTDQGRRLFAIEQGVPRELAAADGPAPGRGALTIAAFAAPRVSPAGAFWAADFETAVGGSAVARFETGGGADTLLASGDVLELAGESRTVRSVGLAAEIAYAAFRSDRLGAGPIADDGALAAHVRLDGGALGNNVPAILIYGPPPDLIVNSTGDASQGGSSAACDTGTTIANGDPECTLRAAIELANLRGREADIGFDLPDSSVISPSAPLPLLGVDARIHVDEGVTITVDGSNAGAADGLLVADARLDLEGLGLRSFSGDCVQAAAPTGVKLTGVSLESCGGIGVFNADGPVELGPLGLRRSVVSGNAGGGVVARGERGEAPLVQVRDTTVELNGPVGIASAEDIGLSNVTVQDHEGPGVVAHLGGAATAGLPSVYFEVGEDSTIARNDGVGIGGFGAVVVGQPVVIEDNASWGVAAGRLVISSDQNPLARRSTIQGNGRGPVCRTVELDGEGRPEAFTDAACAAGGAWLFSPFTAGESLLFDVDVRENAGPGVFSFNRVDMGRVTLMDNEGEGLVVENVAGGVFEPTILIYDASAGEPSVVSGNQGVGLESRLGGIVISSRASIIDNAGWGIFANHTVLMGDELNSSPSPNPIARNGLGTTCLEWWSEDAESPPSRRELPCRGGGIAAMASSDSVRTRLFHLSIEGNGGPGLFTGHAFELGQLSIADNDGPGAILGDEQTFVGRTDFGAVLGSGTRITNNAGEGVYVTVGTVNVPYTSDLRVEDNAGAGILAGAGDVLLADSNSPPSGARIIVQGNGRGGRCRTFHVPRDLKDVVEAEFACMSGGIWTEQQVRGADTDVIDNQGDGIFAAGGVTLRDSRVCRNSGQQIVSENQVLSEVDLVCTDLPDPEPEPNPDPDPTPDPDPMPADDEGGCRCVTPGAPSGVWRFALFVLMSALILAPRPRWRVRPPT